MGIKVESVLTEYPDESKMKRRTLTIRNHWNMKDRVVLIFEDGEERIFIADDLFKAIANAQNHRGI